MYNEEDGQTLEQWSVLSEMAKQFYWYVVERIGNAHAHIVDCDGFTVAKVSTNKDAYQLVRLHNSNIRYAIAKGM